MDGTSSNAENAIGSQELTDVPPPLSHQDSSLPESSQEATDIVNSSLSQEVMTSQEPMNIERADTVLPNSNTANEMDNTRGVEPEHSVSQELTPEDMHPDNTSDSSETINPQN